LTDAALLLDKPVGISSNAALQRAKRIFGARKAGHAGTLDPLASGLLLVLFGEATKFAGPLLDADKEYVATLKLGERTSTGDAEGEIVEKKSVNVSASELAAVLQRFHGPIEQIPPMYSALKRDGVPLYKLARQGTEVERKPRQISISAIELVRFEAPFLELRVRCSKGTYIRVLGEDIAVALGTVAHLAALRRTASGPFQVREAATLDQLESLTPAGRDERLVPLAGLLGGLPRADLDDQTEARFRNGQQVPLAGLGEGLCAVYGGAGDVVGLGMADGAGALRPLRLLATSQAAE
jgi:tRNA pseudouridine55 synthase